jgi:LPPG:FO 2-phospho-L-lactate transferase
MLNAGYALSDVTAALCKRWDIGIELLPMSNDRIETHVTVDHDGERKAMHFQQWWLEHKAEIPAQSFAFVGADTAIAAPGVIAALSEADAIVFAPSNPVVSIAPVLAVPGIKEAVMQRPVVGVSPIIAGAAVRGYADACLRAIGVETDASAVARHFGARAQGGLLNGWLVDDSDHHVCAALTDEGIVTKAVPLWMRDVPTASAMAEAALTLAQDLNA